MRSIVLLVAANEKGKTGEDFQLAVRDCWQPNSYQQQRHDGTKPNHRLRFIPERIGASMLAHQAFAAAIKTTPRRVWPCFPLEGQRGPALWHTSQSMPQHSGCRLPRCGTCRGGANPDILPMVGADVRRRLDSGVYESPPPYVGAYSGRRFHAGWEISGLNAGRRTFPMSAVPGSHTRERA